MTDKSLQVLAVIAHHGTKNRAHLDTMLETFDAMRHEVTVVIVAEEPKDLPDHVDVRVGLPTENPWSLPFAHRAVMAERRADFDVFIYSEDDTLIEERHLDAHVELSAILPEHLLPGFQRYELYPTGERSYSSIHSHYHWDASSVEIHGGLTFARLTNDHGAAYILTKDQLRRAIKSGGFLVEPHEGEYDMLVSAATDVYTRCGMDKVFCVERIEDQLVHHVPNVYLGKLGITARDFDVQLEALLEIGAGTRTSDQLLDHETRLQARTWDRRWYPNATQGLASILPADTSRVLSFGTTTGQPESELIRRGMHVTGIPVDAVIGEVARQRDLEILDPQLPTHDDLETSAPFDAVLLLDVLGYLEDPVETLRQLIPLLSGGAAVVATSPDYRRQRLRERLRAVEARQDLPDSHPKSGLWQTNPAWLRRVLKSAGVSNVKVTHHRARRSDPVGEAGAVNTILGNLAIATGRVVRPAQLLTPARQASST